VEQLTVASTNLLTYSEFQEVVLPPIHLVGKGVAPRADNAKTTAADIFKGFDSLALTTTSSNGGAQTDFLMELLCSWKLIRKFLCNAIYCYERRVHSWLHRHLANLLAASETLSTSGFQTRSLVAFLLLPALTC